MTEKDFWRFLENTWKEKGRAAQVSAVMDSPDPQIKAAGEYIGGHAILPENYQELPENALRDMAELLFDKKAKLETKEAILIILAHQSSKNVLRTLKKYTKNPDRGLEIFSELALSECEMWNE